MSAGGGGRDTLELRGVTIDALKQGLDLWNHGLTLTLGADGAVRFLDAAGQPASFSGTFTLGGACPLYTSPSPRD